jgi:hypothetical protein
MSQFPLKSQPPFQDTMAHWVYGGAAGFLAKVKSLMSPSSSKKDAPAKLAVERERVLVLAKHDCCHGCSCCCCCFVAVVVCCRHVRSAGHH